eukprot:m.21178 g.21178  ORF g.21178 m.21178 type:complete len:375 (+) comp28147_c0_seq5:181-1305(+)
MSSRKERREKKETVPFARGFRRPTQDKCSSALGFKGDPPREYQSDKNFFEPVPNPTSVDDWLAQYNEKGQTYGHFLSENPWFFSPKRNSLKQVFHPSGKTITEMFPEGKIYLLPLGDFDKEPSPQFDLLTEYASKFFQIPVSSLPPVKLERDGNTYRWKEDDGHSASSPPTKKRRCSSRSKGRLGCRIDKKSGHVQLCVDGLLRKLKDVLPDDALCLIALTMFDLYDDEPDLFVAGMAGGLSHVAVFSFHRYDPTLLFSTEFWYEIWQEKVMSMKERKRLILQRSCKLLVHELSHLLGVDHCVFYDCCMNGSGHLEEDFRQSMHLCPVDLRKLVYLCGFDVADRYKQLLEFFSQNRLLEEAAWVRKRLAFLKET